MGITSPSLGLIVVPLRFPESVPDAADHNDHDPGRQYDEEHTQQILLHNDLPSAASREPRFPILGRPLTREQRQRRV